MPGLRRLRDNLRYWRLFRLWFRFRLWLRRFSGSHFRRRLIPIQTPQLLLSQSLLQPCDPAATLVIFRNRIANLRLRRNGLDLRLFRLFEVDDYLFRWRTCSLRVGEYVECFAESSTLRPLDCVQPEI